MKKLNLAILALVLAVLVPLSFSLAAAEVKFVDPDTLKSWLGDPNLLLIDVRPPEAWSEATTKIKGAVRREPAEEKVAVWGKDLPHDKKIVLY